MGQPPKYYDKLYDIISIHPPREGWDPHFRPGSLRQNTFQSTHPVRDGTVCNINDALQEVISIHPPREGWDQAFGLPTSAPNLFQSTHPVRDGTSKLRSMQSLPEISIHPPREGWDRRESGYIQRLCISIHPPREGWDPLMVKATNTTLPFQSTHPVRDGTGRKLYHEGRQYHFNPPTP